jgi:hypothetical protein
MAGVHTNCVSELILQAHAPSPALSTTHNPHQRDKKIGWLNRVTRSSVLHWAVWKIGAVVLSQGERSFSEVQ